MSTLSMPFYPYRRIHLFAIRAQIVFHRPHHETLGWQFHDNWSVTYILSQYYHISIILEFSCCSVYCHVVMEVRYWPRSHLAPTSLQQFPVRGTELKTAYGAALLDSNQGQTYG